MRARLLLRRPRVASTCVALLLLVLLNVLVAANGASLDARSDGFWGLRRIHQCESLGRTADVLFLGSSRTMYGVRAGQVDDTLRAQSGQQILSCNVGQLGSTIEQDYYTLKRMISDGYTPKVAVENLWEWNLNTGASSPADTASDHIQQTLSLADLGDLPNLRWHFLSGPTGVGQTADFVATKLIPLYRDRAGLLATLCGNVEIGPCVHSASHVLTPDTVRIFQRSNRQGWISEGDKPISQLSPDELHFKQTHADAYYAGYFKHFTIGGRQPKALADLVTLARQHNIRLAFVISPLHPSLYRYMERPSDWQTIAAYWQSFARAHDVPLYDQSHAPGYTDDDFVDPQHLSPAGATKFSSWLAPHVVAPLLR